MKDPLIDYYQARGEFIGNIWRVRFDTVTISTIPEADYEQAQRTMAAMGNAFSRAINDALFNGMIPNPGPILTACEGNQHVFGYGDKYCRCGKVESL